MENQLLTATRHKEATDDLLESNKNDYHNLCAEKDNKINEYITTISELEFSLMKLKQINDE